MLRNPRAFYPFAESHAKILTNDVLERKSGLAIFTAWSAKLRFFMFRKV